MRYQARTVCMILVLATAAGSSESKLNAYDSFPELHGPYLGQTPPGKIPEIFCDGFLKPAGGYHSSIVFSPDMKEAYWTSMGAHTYCSMVKNGRWTTPTEISFDSAYSIGEATLSPDGKRLYFLSRRPPDDEPVERERIWYAEREQDGWSNSRLIDKVVWSHPTHWSFSIAESGNLYFTSEAEGVMGEGDIYVAQWDSLRFLSPVDLGGNVNSQLRDFAPFVAPDESFLIFARVVPEEGTRSDLYICFKRTDGTWTPAVNMGDAINSEHNEVCPVVTPDGKYLFYLSASSERNEVYWVDTEIITRLRREILK